MKFWTHERVMAALWSINALAMLTFALLWTSRGDWKDCVSCLYLFNAYFLIVLLYLRIDSMKRERESPNA